jgi:preprotein translocase subunit YajC
MQVMHIVNNIINSLVSPAYAGIANPQTPQNGGGFSLVLMTGVFILFMYFVMWRPQSKRAKEHRNLLNSLSKGDEIVTTGGILGKITKISDSYAILTLADNVNITVQKSSIASALPKGTLKSIQ